jgi:hypothetical protein
MILAMRELSPTKRNHEIVKQKQITYNNNSNIKMDRKAMPITQIPTNNNNRVNKS